MLMKFTIDARLVVLPDPVGPVTSNRTGGWPTEMCKSLALSWMTVVSSLSIRTCPVDTGSASLTDDRPRSSDEADAPPRRTGRGTGSKEPDGHCLGALFRHPAAGQRRT